MITIAIIILILRLLRRYDDETIVAKVLERHPKLRNHERELRKAIRAIRREMTQED